MTSYRGFEGVGGGSQGVPDRGTKRTKVKMVFIGSTVKGDAVPFVSRKSFLRVRNDSTPALFVDDGEPKHTHTHTKKKLTDEGT